MNIGFKLYSPDQIELFSKFSDCVDFVEIMAVQKYNILAFDSIKCPVYIHCEHENFGINLADKEKENLNRRAIMHCLRLADRLNARKVVIHPGHIESDKCSKEQAISLLSGFNDNRIIIENMPIKGVFKLLACETESIKWIMQKSSKGLCLDFGHATLVALAHGSSPLEFVSSIVALGPSYYHISDAIYETKEDHTHLGKGNAPLKEYLMMIPKDSYITVETAKENEQIILSDIKYIRDLIV